MKTVIWYDKGYAERLIIGNEEIGRVDNLSARQLLSILQRHGVLTLQTITFDDYENNRNQVNPTLLNALEGDIQRNKKSILEPFLGSPLDPISYLKDFFANHPVYDDSEE